MADTFPRTAAPQVSHRTVLGIALPMTLAYLTTPILGLVDTAVIGQLGDAALLGGIAVGAILFGLIFTPFNFLRSGTTGLTAQAVGAGNEKEEGAVFLRAALVALVSGFAMTALQVPILWLGLTLIAPSTAVAEATATYFQIRILAAPFTLTNYAVLGWVIGQGRAGLGLKLQLFLNGLNITLSVSFVLGLGWGIAGVAAATVIAEAATAAVGCMVAGRWARGVPWPSRARVFEPRAFRRMLAVNRDIMIRSFTLIFAFAFFTRAGARAGDVTLAANAILMNFFMVGGYFLDGLATAAEQLAGQALGARRRAAFSRAVRLTLFWSLALSAVASLAFWISGPTVIDFLTTSPDVRETARIYLVWAALTPIAGALAFHMDGVFIGATWTEDMRNMMLASLALYLAVWAIATPALANHGLWLALLTFLGARGLTLSWRYRIRLARAFAPPPPMPTGVTCP